MVWLDGARPTPKVQVKIMLVDTEPIFTAGFSDQSVIRILRFGLMELDHYPRVLLKIFMLNYDFGKATKFIIG